MTCGSCTLSLSEIEGDTTNDLCLPPKASTDLQLDQAEISVGKFRGGISFTETVVKKTARP